MLSLKFMQTEDVIPNCILHNAEISDNLGFSWFALLKGCVLAEDSNG